MKATFENTDNVLWPGLSVSTRLLVDTLKQVIVVPEDAVQRGPSGLYAIRRRRREQGRDEKCQGRSRGQWAVGHPAGSVSRRKSGDRGPIPIATRRFGRSRPKRVLRSRRRKRHQALPLRRPDDGGRHFRAVHSASDRNFTVDGRHPVRRHRRLSEIAGRAFAAGRFPDHSGFGATSRRQPRHDGFRRGPATRDAIRADFRRRANDLDKHAWLDCDYHPVRSRPQHRRGVERRAGGDQRRRRAIAEEICRPRRLTAR